MQDRLKLIREQLMEQLRNLNQDVAQSLDELCAQEDRHHIADLEDLAGDSTSDAVVFEQFRTSGATLEQIQRAIERIDEGVYDLCEECESAIGEARLAALPFAIHCIECRRKLEAASG